MCLLHFSPVSDPRTYLWIVDPAKALLHSFNIQTTVTVKHQKGRRKFQIELRLAREEQYSRNVSQTRWIIDDERINQASVEEIIGGNILPMCRGDNYSLIPLVERIFISNMLLWFGFLVILKEEDLQSVSLLKGSGFFCSLGRNRC
ncbi:Pseudouridine synthase family protein [Quillaja saponaria]|uniref:tRNA pseudouridine(55) synthase n=1 Tax=Quillaja saponaria TaxID=32244 RepID=A0AAD7PTV8_QUISA|nr:Pseudouridine synthase family protein [Quillaja saponaria]